jgi:membrane-associated phospholipid phosphatase
LNNKTGTIVLLIFLSAAQIFSGDSLKTHKPGIWDDLLYDTKVFISDGAAFYSAPFGFNSKEWLYTGAGMLGLGLILSQDKNLHSSLSKGVNEGDFWSVVKNGGDVKYTSIGSGTVYLAGLFMRNKTIRETGRMLLQSLIYSGIITVLFKTVTGRSRPYFSESQYDFNWFEKAEEKQAFPSGHATVAFAVSTVFAERINTWWSRTLFYSLAALTAYSRIHDNQHWVSDVAFGSLIGFGSGYFVVHTNNNRKSKSRFSFTPAINGFSAKYIF